MMVADAERGPSTLAGGADAGAGSPAPAAALARAAVSTAAHRRIADDAARTP